MSLFESPEGTRTIPMNLNEASIHISTARYAFLALAVNLT